MASDYSLRRDTSSLTPLQTPALQTAFNQYYQEHLVDLSNPHSQASYDWVTGFHLNSNEDISFKIGDDVHMDYSSKRDLYIRIDKCIMLIVRDKAYSLCLDFGTITKEQVISLTKMIANLQMSANFLSFTQRASGRQLEFLEVPRQYSFPDYLVSRTCVRHSPLC